MCFFLKKDVLREVQNLNTESAWFMLTDIMSSPIDGKVRKVYQQCLSTVER